jgi:hypothetical protein
MAKLGIKEKSYTRETINKFNIRKCYYVNERLTMMVTKEAKRQKISEALLVQNIMKNYFVLKYLGINKISGSVRINNKLKTESRRNDRLFNRAEVLIGTDLSITTTKTTSTTK